MLKGEHHSRASKRNLKKKTEERWKNRRFRARVIRKMKVSGLRRRKRVETVVVL